MSGIDWKSLKKTADDATRALPADWYDVVVDKAVQKPASTGSEMIVVTFKVDAGPHAGRAVFTNLVLSPESGFALSIFFRNLAALGVDDNFFGQLTQSGMDVRASLVTIAEAIVGRRARVQLGVRQWQGQDRNEVLNMTASTTGAGGVPGTQAPIGGLPAGGSPLGGPPVPPSSFGAPPTPPTPVSAATPASVTPPVPTTSAPATLSGAEPTATPPLPF